MKNLMYVWLMTLPIIIGFMSNSLLFYLITLAYIVLLACSNRVRGIIRKAYKENEVLTEKLLGDE